ncbi:MAG: response regulator, partial [Dethiobacteria bacterium]
MLPGRKKPRVLIIDNAADNIASISESLKDKYGVRVATNGKVALEVAGKTIPDIILMNVSIPILNGYETCRRLKKDQRLQDIPILFLTSGIDKENEKRGFALGAADYITMPPSPPILLARIRTHLALKEARNTLLRQNHLLEEK